MATTTKRKKPDLSPLPVEQAINVCVLMFFGIVIGAALLLIVDSVMR